MIVALVNLVANGQAAVDAVIGILDDLGIGSVVGNESLTSVIHTLLVQDSSAKALLSVGLLVAVWSASGFVSTFTRASNRIYGVREGRAWWKLQLAEIGLAAVALVLLAVAAAGLVISGPLVDAVGNAVGAGETARTVYSIGRWPVLIVIAIVLLSLLFWIAPNVKQPRFRWLTLGGAVALLVWTLVSFLFGLYVANFGSYDRTYGSLGAIMAFLVWLFLSNTAILLGVQVNAEVQRGRLIQAGDGESGGASRTRNRVCRRTARARNSTATSAIRTAQEGEHQMSTVTESVDVAVPVRTAYNQWTQFEEFPRFMERRTEIRQLDRHTTHWKTDIDGVKREFDAKITEQLPDERVAWTSTEGSKQAGVVTFHRLDENLTRVTCQMDFEPDGLVEKAGDKLGFLDRQVKGDMSGSRSTSRVAAASRPANGAVRSTVPPRDPNA